MFIHQQWYRSFIVEISTGTGHPILTCSLHLGQLWLSVIVSTAKKEGCLKVIATLISEYKGMYLESS